MNKPNKIPRGTGNNRELKVTPSNNLILLVRSIHYIISLFNLFKWAFESELSKQGIANDNDIDLVVP